MIGIGIGVPFSFSSPIDANAQTIYNRIIADGGVSNLTRLNFFVKGLKAIYGDLANVPVCYDAHWIGYKLGSGTGATAGQAAAKLYSLTVAGDAVQSTAASQPLLLSHNGASSDNYWWGSGVQGNFASTPNAAANQITGDIEIISYINLPNPTSYNNLVTKDDATSNRIFIFSLGSNVLSFATNFGAGLVTYSSTTSLPSSVNRWVRVTRNSSNGEVKFFYSADAVTTTPNSVTWIQLGATVSGTIGASVTGTSIVAIGAQAATGLNAVQGRIHRATISNSIGGAPVVDFNPAQYNASTSQTAWTSNTGEVWTINTDSAASGFAGRLVNRTICAFGGAAQTSSFTANTSIQVNQPDTVYSAFKFDVFNAYQGIFDSNTATTRQQFNNGVNSGGLEMNAGGGSINTIGLSQNSLKLATVLYNGASSSLQVNNGTAITGSTGTQRMDGLKLGTLNSNSFTLKGVINTLVVSAANDNTTTKTAMYNLIRSLNNNSF